jgi:putative DNA primase/helicase
VIAIDVHASSANGTCRGLVEARHAWQNDLGEVVQGDLIHRDRFDVTSATSRTRFAKAVAEKLQMPAAVGDVEGLLLCRLEELRKVTPTDRYDPGEDENAERRGAELLTQEANAELLVAELDGNARWNASRGMWMEFRDGRHVLDEKGHVEQVAKAIARRTWSLRARPPVGVDPREAERHAKDSEKAAGISAMMKLAQTEPGISIVASDLDRDGELFNGKNGTVHLPTGQIREHRREDLLSKLAPVAFNPAATCPLFDRFIDRIMAGDITMIAYIRRILGKALSADQTTQELYIFHGGGANGKNVLLDTFCGMAGNYAGVAPDSLLTARSQAEHPTEIADLCGMRLVFASETEHGAKLRVQLVKKLTGDATIKARYMRQDFFAFPRTWTLILVTNNKPVIGETTHAVWRRVRLVPFTVTIPEAERDPELTEKLKAEWPGIFNWCLRGYQDFRANGMQTPEAVKVATDEYQGEQDVLGEFLSDRCILGEDQKVARTQIYAEYVAWSRGISASEVLDRNGFYDHLRRLDGVFEASKRFAGKLTRAFTGIGLANLSTQYQQAQEEVANA